MNTFADRKLGSLDALTKTLDRTSLVGQAPAGSLDGERAIQADGNVYFVDLGPKRDLDRAIEAPWETWLERKKQYFSDVLALDDVGTVLVSRRATRARSIASADPATSRPWPISRSARRPRCAACPRAR